MPFFQSSTVQLPCFQFSSFNASKIELAGFCFALFVFVAASHSSVHTELASQGYFI